MINAAGLHPGVVVVDPEGRPHFSSRVGEHGEGDAALDHLRQLVVVPHLVDEHAVDAHGKDLHAELLEIVIFFGNCRNFGRSDEGEVTRVETEQDPLAEILRQLHGHELALVVGRG